MTAAIDMTLHQEERRLQALGQLYCSLTNNPNPSENTRRCIGEVEGLLMDMAHKIANSTAMVPADEPETIEEEDDTMSFEDEPEEEEEPDPSED